MRTLFAQLLLLTLNVTGRIQIFFHTSLVSIAKLADQKKGAFRNHIQQAEFPAHERFTFLLRITLAKLRKNNLRGLRSIGSGCRRVLKTMVEPGVSDFITGMLDIFGKALA